MRLALILATASTLAGPALASSIAPAGTVTNAGSVVTRACKDCPALKPSVNQHSYVVPALKPGTQLVEIKDIDGQKKLVRTEAWMGGSPVVYIGKAPAGASGEVKSADDAAPAPLSVTATQTQAIEAAPLGDMRPSRDGIDKSATTSALASTAFETRAAATIGAKDHMDALDTSKFELRLP